MISTAQIEETKPTHLMQYISTTVPQIIHNPTAVSNKMISIFKSISEKSQKNFLKILTKHIRHRL